jgi:hypothetical protein
MWNPCPDFDLNFLSWEIWLHIIQIIFELKTFADEKVTLGWVISFIGYGGFMENFDSRLVVQFVDAGDIFTACC